MRAKINKNKFYFITHTTPHPYVKILFLTILINHKLFVQNIFYKIGNQAAYAREGSADCD